MTIIKKQVIDRFNQGAFTYDAAADVQINIAAHLASSLKNITPKTILEIGSGTGLLSQHLSELFPTSSLLLIDIAEKMLEKCRQRISHHPQMTTLCMDGENLTLDSGFDLIVSSMAMQWFGDLKKSVTEIIKRLNPDGRFVFSLPGNNSFQEWHTICRTFDLPIATPFFPSKEMLSDIFPNVKLQVVEYQQHYPSAYLFLQALKQLGSRAPHANYNVLTAGKLRKALRHFEKEMTITYEIFYGEYVKS